MKSWIVPMTFEFVGHVFVQANTPEEARAKAQEGPSHWDDCEPDEMINWMTDGKPIVNE